MPVSDHPVTADGLAGEALRGGSPTAWFEQLYAAAARADAVVPWDRGEPHPLLVQALDSTDGAGRRAVVVGCGFGSDAEYVASRGFATTAFDISASAVAGATQRFPGTGVDYRVADLFDLPPEWQESFDLVVESLTVQALPRALRQDAIAAVRSLVKDALLVISGALDDDGDPAEGPPWPLTADELELFATDGLTVRNIERPPGTDGAGSSRWLALFQREAANPG